MTNSLQQEIWKDMIQWKYGFRPIDINLCTFLWICKGKNKTDENIHFATNSSNR